MYVVNIQLAFHTQTPVFRVMTVRKLCRLETKFYI